MSRSWDSLVRRVKGWVHPEETYSQKCLEEKFGVPVVFGPPWVVNKYVLLFPSHFLWPLPSSVFSPSAIPFDLVFQSKGKMFRKASNQQDQ